MPTTEERENGLRDFYVLIASRYTVPGFCMMGRRMKVGKFVRPCVFSGALLINISGCAFSALEQDLDKLAEVTHSFSGTVSTNGRETEAIVIVALDNRDGEGIATFRMMSTEGPFEIRSNIAPTFFFGFEDINKDLRFQANEPYGWGSDGEAIDPASGSTDSIEITIVTDSAQPAYPLQLVNEPFADHIRSALQFNTGTVSSLDNPWFSRDQAGKGLWEPYAFMEDGGAGIHFLEPYDSNKIPVLFVHGINATPQDFTTVIEHLDTSQYQAWIFSYPSGLRLPWLAQGLYQFMELLHLEYQFRDLHLVAHSMGGLTSRGAVNLCAKNRSCEYLRSFTAISAPWNGVASVKGGLQWAPTVIPVWKDLDPDGEYVTALFDTPLPEGLPFHLMFSFKQDSFFGSSSSDGVIRMSSQLRLAAQNQSQTMRGYDEGHVSILSSETAISGLYQMISESTP